MTTITETCESATNLSFSQRGARAITALAMLALPAFLTTPLGIIAVLPLLAIYPMFTAVVGWDPIEYVLTSADSRNEKIVSMASRIGLATVSVVLLSAVLLAQANPLGSLVILALISIVPMFVALIGENPLSALVDSNKKLSDLSQSIDKPQKDREFNVVNYAVNDDNFDLGDRKGPAHDAAA